MNSTSLPFFACLHFQCSMNTLYTTLTSRAIKKQLCRHVRFHYACLLPYRWQYRHVTTVFQLLREICFLAGVRFSFDCPLYLNLLKLKHILSCFKDTNQKYINKVHFILLTLSEDDLMGTNMLHVIALII